MTSREACQKRATPEDRAEGKKGRKGRKNLQKQVDSGKKVISGTLAYDPSTQNIRKSGFQLF